MKFELNHYSISFYTVSEFFSVIDSIQLFQKSFQFSFSRHISIYIISVTVFIDCCRTQSSAY